MGSTPRLKWAAVISQKKVLASRAISGTFNMWTAPTILKPPKILAHSPSNQTATISKQAATVIGEGTFTTAALAGTRTAHEQAIIQEERKKNGKTKKKRKGKSLWITVLFNVVLLSLCTPHPLFLVLVFVRFLLSNETCFWWEF